MKNIIELNPNTDLCVDVKTLLREDRMAVIGKKYPGFFVHDEDDHYTLVETDPQLPEKRNPCLFKGNFVTITRRDDGTLRPNFRPAQIGTDFDYETYADAVAHELRQALQDLVGKKVTRRKRSSTQGR